MIGSVGPGLPQDLFAATGRYAGPLGWDVNRVTPASDRWLESKFPPWARHILQDWADGALDHLGEVVFSRADDSAQRLYYYVTELQRNGTLNGPEPLLLDIAKIRRPSSLDHTVDAVRRLAHRFGLDHEALEAGIVETNQRRLAQAATVGGPTCLLIGTPPPDGRLHDAIASAGFTPFGRTLVEAWSDPRPAVDEASGDPALAIARQLHQRPDDQRGFGDQSAMTLELAGLHTARAAVLWYAEEDESRVWNVPAIRDALAVAGVPTLILTRRDWALQDGAADEVRQFLEGIER